ncbi:MAG: sigma factor-like helix-turn-helix DNA-binding protein [Oscillospiraceae bacterium]
MLAKDVLRNGIDIDNRIIEQITQHRIWSELYDAVSYCEPLANLVEDVLENKETELTELIRMKDNLENIIMCIHNCDQRDILRLRYFDNLPWDCVADHMGAEIEWVKEQHHKALKKIHVDCVYGDDFDADEE